MEDEVLKSLSDEECFVQIIRALDTPIARRKFQGSDFEYCLNRLLKNEKVQELLYNYNV